MTTATSTVDRIILCETEADALDARSDALRWEAAELYAQELAGGRTQRELAAEVGKSQQHVSIMRRVHDHYLGSNDRPSFNDAYQQVKRGKPETPPDPDPPEPIDDLPEWHGPPQTESDREHLRMGELTDYLIGEVYSAETNDVYKTDAHLSVKTAENLEFIAEVSMRIAKKLRGYAQQDAPKP